MPSDEVDGVQTKPALPDWAKKRLDELHTRLMLPATRRIIYDELLTDEERSLLDEATQPVRDIISFWGKSRKKSYVAAMLELGHRINLLAPGDRDNLAAILGETVVVPADAKPHWDRESLTLRFCGQVVMRWTPMAGQFLALDKVLSCRASGP